MSEILSFNLTDGGSVIVEAGKRITARHVEAVGGFGYFRISCAG